MNKLKPVCVASLCLFILLGCSNVNPSENFRLRVSELEKSVDSKADVEAEVRFGREVAARFLGRYDGQTNNLLQRYVNTLGQHLAQFSGRSDIEFHFLVVDSEEINAYAMPGGYVFVTSAAIELMDNEAELAGVLAHEIAHVREKHVVRALNIRGQTSGAALSQLTSGASDAFRIALNQATEAALSILTEKGLQKTDEYEADEIGLFIMVQAGYEPDAYLAYLSRLGLKTHSELSELSKTHPSIEARLNRLAQLKKSNGLENLNYAVLEERFLKFKP